MNRKVDADGPAGPAGSAGYAGTVGEIARSVRGSVLIFAVVVLAILAMLSSAFLIVARHAIAASKSGLISVQADLAANAGIGRASSFLGASLRGNYIVTRHGVLVLNGTALQETQASDISNTGAAENSPYNMFVHPSTFDVTNNTTTPGFAVLSSYYYDPRFLGTNGAPGTPFYTTAPLRINPIPLPNSVANDPGADRASAYFVRSNMVELFNGATSNLRKGMPSVGTIRARHFIWVRDLDANFYVVPSMWGLNTKGIPGYSTAATSIPNYTQSEQGIAAAILQYLRNTPASDMSTTMQSADPSFISGILPTDTFDNIGAFALRFPNYETDANYSFWRADIEQYFTTYLDGQHNPDGSLPVDSNGVVIPPIATFKNAPAAININTAPEEVLQAMFSQIPYTDALTFGTYSPPGALPIPPNTHPPVMSELIAKRIVAKRPFLSRMDFEDFVASLLPASPQDPPTFTDVTVIPDVHYPLGAIYAAMQLRIDREIRLAQFMEMPGLPEGDYPDGKINPYKNCNSTTYMLNRFRNVFLVEDNLLAPTRPTRTECTLTVKAFNNFLNSVSTSPGIAFHVTSLLMQPGDVGTANAVVMTFDPTDTYSPTQIRLGGDDVYDAAHNQINAGPNGIAESGVFGYSYYSHDYGGRFPIPEYKPARWLNQPSQAGLDITSPAQCGKFVYFGEDNSDPNLKFGPANLLAAGYAAGFKNYFIEDLKKWSCVGDGKISGYYDMYFNPYDAMKLEFGHSIADENPGPPPPTPAPTDIGVQLVTLIAPGILPPGTMLRTGVVHYDDIQEVNLGEPLPDPTNPLVVLPGPNGKIEVSPNSGFGLGDSQPTTVGDDIGATAIRFGVSNTAPLIVVSPDRLVQSANDPYLYIVPGVGKTALATSPRPNNPNAAPGDSDTLVQVIIDGGNGTGDTQVPDDLADTSGLTVTVGPNKHNETTVWGPLRASQRGEDQLLASTNPDVASQVPTATITSGNNGDVAWSPQICFRSRYYGMYVLAQGLNSQPKVYGTVSAASAGGHTLTFTTPDTSNDLSVILSHGSLLAIQTIPTTPPGTTVAQTHVYTVDTFTSGASSVTVTLSSPLLADVNANDNAAFYTTKLAGERRMEVNYDAFNDEILWQRSPVTEKRALGDPQ